MHPLSSPSTYPLPIHHPIHTVTHPSFSSTYPFMCLPTHLHLHSHPIICLFSQSSTHLATYLLRPTHSLICPHTLPYVYTSASIHPFFYLLPSIHLYIPTVSSSTLSSTIYSSTLPPIHTSICPSLPPFSSSVLPLIYLLFYPSIPPCSSIHPSMNLSSTA